MARVLLFVVLAAIVVAGAWWVASLPGQVAASVAGYSFEASAPVALLLLALLFLVIYLVLRLLAGLFRLPGRSRRRAAARARARGDQAVSRALIALAAGETSDARTASARARRYLGDTPQTLMLAASAAQRAGRDAEAETIYREMATREDAAFLGYRGLLRLARSREDWTGAADLARRADASHPGSTWLRGERAQLAIRAEQWQDALALAGPDTPKAALAAAAANAETNPAAALSLAKRAWKADPALTPAALAYARRLRETGQERQAQKVLKKAWDLRQQPELADYALAFAPNKLARMQAAATFVVGTRGNPESHLLLAQTALEAGLTGEARSHAEAVLNAGLRQRRVYALLAAVAEAEGNATANTEALREAANADPDPVWRCEACGTEHKVWHPACPHCHTAGRIVWSTPARALAVR